MVNVPSYIPLLYTISKIPDPVISSVFPRFKFSLQSEKLNPAIQYQIQISDRQDTEKHNIPDRISFLHRIAQIRQNTAKKNNKAWQHPRFHNMPDHIKFGGCI